jgi:hypothetical protein
VTTDEATDLVNHVLRLSQKVVDSRLDHEGRIVLTTNDADEFDSARQQKWFVFVVPVQQ